MYLYYECEWLLFVTPDCDGQTVRHPDYGYLIPMWYIPDISKINMIMMMMMKLSIG